MRLIRLIYCKRKSFMIEYYQIIIGAKIMEELMKEIKQFNEESMWDKFHSPQNQYQLKLENF